MHGVGPGRGACVEQRTEAVTSRQPARASKSATRQSKVSVDTESERIGQSPW